MYIDMYLISSLLYMCICLIGDIIDACAAPGNKTSHMAALLHNHSLNKNGKCKIYAYDRDKLRCKLLQSRITQAGADKIVSVECNNFLNIDVQDHKFSRLSSILLDPSCSGSGVIRALDRVLEAKKRKSDEDNDDSRLQNLRQFQISAIKKVRVID